MRHLHRPHQPDSDQERTAQPNARPVRSRLRKLGRDQSGGAFWRSQPRCAPAGALLQHDNRHDRREVSNQSAFCRSIVGDVGQPQQQSRLPRRHSPAPRSASRRRVHFMTSGTVPARITQVEQPQVASPLATAASVRHRGWPCRQRIGVDHRQDDQPADGLAAQAGSRNQSDRPCTMPSTGTSSSSNRAITSGTRFRKRPGRGTVIRCIADGGSISPACAPDAASSSACRGIEESVACFSFAPNSRRRSESFQAVDRPAHRTPDAAGIPPPPHRPATRAMRHD